MGSTILTKWRSTVLLMLILISQAHSVSPIQPADKENADETVPASEIHGGATIRPGALILPPIHFHSPLLNLTLNLKLRDHTRHHLNNNTNMGNRPNPVFEKHIYQDFSKQSALSVFRDESGALSYRGLLTADTTIEPVNDPSTDDKGHMVQAHSDKHGNVHRQHVIRRRSLLPHDGSSTRYWQPHYGAIVENSVPFGGGSAECSLPQLTAEVVILLDNQLSNKLSGEDRVLEHSLLYISAMEVYFSTISCPRIHIHHVNTAGMTSFSRESFFNNHIMHGNEVDIDAAMPSVAEYLYKKDKEFESFDVVLLLTKRNLCCRRDCKCDGMAYVGGACTMNRREQTIKTFAVVEEDSSFRSVATAVHEFGHLMRSRHDGDSNTAAEWCSSSEGYIMAASRTSGENQFKWSQCSVESIRKFADSSQSECMRNQPDVFQEDVDLRKRALTADEQCHAQYGAGACTSDHTICRELYCRVISIGRCKTTGPAMEGTPCNAKDNRPGHCHLGNCL